MARNPALLLYRLGAIAGGLVLGLALCVALPLAALTEVLFRRRAAASGPGPLPPAPPPSSLPPPPPNKPLCRPAADHHVIDIVAASRGSSGSEPPSPPPPPPPPREEPFVTTDERLLLPLFRAHGTGALHFAASLGPNPEFAHLYCPSLGPGSIAFVSAPLPGPAGRLLLGGEPTAVMAVGDPLAPRERWGDVGRAFLRRFPRGGFFGYVSEDFAKELLRVEQGLHANDWGLSTRILPPAAAADGRAGAGVGRRSARQEARRAQKSGLRVREVLLPDELLPPSGGGGRQASALLRAALRDVSAQWLATRVTRDRELRVFCRRLDLLEDDQALLRDARAGTRLFVAERDGAADQGRGRVVEAFALLDPQCRGGRVVGWVLASARARRDAHRGALKLLVQHLAALHSPAPLELGLSPFAGLAPVERCPFGGGAKWMRLTARFLFACADGRLYAFRGLAASKAQYRGANGGEHVSLYCVHRGGGGWVPRLAFLADLYAIMVFVGFCGDGVGDTVLKLWGWR